MNESKLAIDVKGLKKSFHGKTVCCDVSFSVCKGSIFSILGSNGAGKTTIIRILTTQIQPDGGSVVIEGIDALKSANEVRRLISVTGQFSTLDEGLSGKENLMMIAQLLHLEDIEKKVEELMNLFELTPYANQKAATYSGGMKRKLDIAMSLIGHPKVIFLDEPTTGLDPQSRRTMWNMIKKLKDSGVTILLTTQYLEEAEQLADTIAILDKGKIIAKGSVEELKDYLPKGGIRFIFKTVDDLKQALSFVKDYKVTTDDLKKQLIVFMDDEVEILTKLLCSFSQHQISVVQVAQQEVHLEDVFLAMIENRKGENNEKK